MPRKTAELLRHWVSDGFSNQAIAGYGTSVEFLERAVTSGQIPWGASYTDQNLLAYQKDILTSGGYLYFAYPFAENLEHYKPSLVRRLREISDLSHDSMRRRLKTHAGWQAIEHHFESLIGTKLLDETQIVALTYLLFPTSVTQYKDDAFLDFTFHWFQDAADWQHPPLFGFENSSMSILELKGILTQSIARRGTIIYYNEKLLRNQIREGFESEDEILIHSRKPLTLEVISGIETLAETDREAVESLIQKLETKQS
ncbi:hypothetical protein HYU45_04385 [Candidatus Daviesbacteria bacterium]|nr:hypothetical protein [Candidatus Daviesbacteria bacterium]MBI4038059.1 hypothetical protein [Candidatus Daviesbacteria bacterium]